MLCIFASAGLFSACSQTTDHNDQSSASVALDLERQELSAPSVRAFAPTPDDAHDIAVLEEFHEKFNLMRNALNDNTKKFQQQGNLNAEMTFHRQREYVQSALNMLNALELRTEQGRYIQGLLYQYWEDQAMYDDSHSLLNNVNPEEFGHIGDDYLSAEAQLNHWKSLQPKKK